MTQAVLFLRIAEMLALESQLFDPPKPMPPALHARLEVAFRNTAAEVDALLRQGYDYELAEK
jgi:hypothetical protein